MFYSDFVVFAVAVVDLLKVAACFATVVVVVDWLKAAVCSTYSQSYHFDCVGKHFRSCPNTYYWPSLKVVPYCSHYLLCVPCRIV